MNSTHLFDPGPGVPEGKRMSSDKRRTFRQKQMIERGRHPATKIPLRAEPGETCGSCANFRRHGKYFKCGLVLLTGGPGTDIRSGWPACERWEEADE